MGSAGVAPRLQGRGSTVGSHRLSRSAACETLDQGTQSPALAGGFLSTESPGSPRHPFSACESCNTVPFLMPDIGNLFLSSWLFVSLGKDLSIFISVIKKIVFYFIEFLHDLSIFIYFCL